MLSILASPLIWSSLPQYSSAIVLITTLVLLSLLITKDISGSIREAPMKRLSQALDVVIIPLMIVFVINAFLFVKDAIR